MNRDDAAEFIERHGVTFENLIADPLEGTALYSRLTGRPWIGTPTFMVYSRDGELLAQQRLGNGNQKTGRQEYIRHHQPHHKTCFLPPIIHILCTNDQCVFPFVHGLGHDAVSGGKG